MHNCPICNSPQHFDIVVHYRYAHLWYILSWITQRQYTQTCSRCHNGTSVPQEQVRDKLFDKDPIPFIRRKGWLVFLGFFALLMVLAVCLSIVGANQFEESVAKPQTGDLYHADLSRISKGFDKGPAYGIMKLITTEKNSERFIIARVGYSKKYDEGKDIANGNANRDDYYDTNDIIDLTPDQVLQFSHEGVIYKVTSSH